MLIYIYIYIYTRGRRGPTSPRPCPLWTVVPNKVLSLSLSLSQLSRNPVNSTTAPARMFVIDALPRLHQKGTCGPVPVGRPDQSRSWPRQETVTRGFHVVPNKALSLSLSLSLIL
jgi:hypothetical protein